MEVLVDYLRCMSESDNENQVSDVLDMFSQKLYRQFDGNQRLWRWEVAVLRDSARR